MNKPEMDARSKDSAAMVEYWDLTDALIEGLSALKAEKTKFLPKFPGEKDDNYNFRLSLAEMTNIYRDVVEALAAKPFEEKITFANENVPQQMKEFADNVDGAGNNITVFASLTFFNGINSAIDWIFIDFPTVSTEKVKTVDDQKKLGVRPFWSHVLGRNVLEARTGIVNGLEVLNYIRILEPVTGQVRVFERSLNSVVTWSLWEKNDKKEWIKVNEGQLTIDVIPLVPFATGRRDGRGFKYYPAMRDAADLQRKLYRNESALEFTKTMSAFPMLAGNGVKPERDAAGNVKEIALGPTMVLYAPPSGDGKSGQWSFIEPAATSLAFLAADIAATKQDLRELGRQPLTAQSGNLTTITTAVAAGKAKSAVGAWALALKDTLDNALMITAKWLNVADETTVTVYHDFDNFTENGPDLEQLRKARDGGDLSQKTYWFELKRRRVLSPEFDAEQEVTNIANEAPGDEYDDDTQPGDDPQERDDDTQPGDDPANRGMNA